MRIELYFGSLPCTVLWDTQRIALQYLHCLALTFMVLFHCPQGELLSDSYRCGLNSCDSGGIRTYDCLSVDLWNERVSRE